MENIEKHRDKSRRWRINNPEKYQAQLARQKAKRLLQRLDEEAKHRKRGALELTSREERHRQARKLGDIWIQFIARFAHRLTAEKREKFLQARSVYDAAKGRQAINHEYYVAHREEVIQRAREYKNAHR